MSIDPFNGRREELLEEVRRFTPRQFEVTRKLARGYSYKDIAEELGISHHTVNTHVKAILRRLKLSGSRKLALLMIHFDQEHQVLHDGRVTASSVESRPAF